MDVSNITEMYDMFENATSFNQPIGVWNVSNVTDISCMFTGASAFNQDLNSWNVSKVTNMMGTFSYASSFNGNIGNWDVSNVRDMSSMFLNAKSFNQNIGAWNVSSVITMDKMFFQCFLFNQDIGNWDVGKVTDMTNMFTSARVFNQNIDAWNVSSVSDMACMFNGATVFNKDISSWDVSKVTNMCAMFCDASLFNQDISTWDVSSVTDMSYMFNRASYFNQNISSWDVSAVTNMGGMFNTTVFNKDISSWDVSSVTNMSGMFEGSQFNQDLSNWDVSKVTDMASMFHSVKLSSAFYNNIIISWASKTLKNSVVFDGGTSTYSSGAAANARQNIINNYGWAITDGGVSTLPAISTQELSNITMTGATTGGSINTDGGSAITAKGVVWHIGLNPTTTANLGMTSNGSGSGAYSSSISGLTAGTTYYVRAYATNANGTEYGNTLKLVAQQELTISGTFTTTNKVYDNSASTSIVTNNLTLTGILGGYPNVTLSNVVITFDNCNAGNNKTVSIKSAQLSGTDAGKYRLILVGSPTTTANITAKALTVKGAVVSNKVYDGTTSASITVSTLLGVISGDLVTLNTKTGTFDNKKCWNCQSGYGCNNLIRNSCHQLCINPTNRTNCQHYCQNINSNWCSGFQ